MPEGVTKVGNLFFFLKKVYKYIQNGGFAANCRQLIFGSDTSATEIFHLLNERWKNTTCAPFLFTVTVTVHLDEQSVGVTQPGSLMPFWGCTLGPTHTHCDDTLRYLCLGVLFVFEAVEDKLWAAARKKRWRMDRSELGSMLRQQKDWHWLFCFADARHWLARLSFSLEQQPPASTFPRCFDQEQPLTWCVVDVPLTGLIRPLLRAT